VAAAVVKPRLRQHPTLAAPRQRLENSEAI
jgi:hypothetical protein